MIRRLLLLEHPQETRFFLFLGGFGLVLAVVYWVLTYELAGSTLLAGFGLGAGLLGVVLLRSRPRRVAETAARERRAPAQERPILPAGEDTDVPGGEPGEVDTPFDDPSGRLPDETLAPLSLGLGLALAVTAVVFGPWLLVAGLLPLGWGAWTWLAGARDELDATVEDETQTATLPAAEPRDAAAGAAGRPGAGPRNAAASATGTARARPEAGEP